MAKRIGLVGSNGAGKSRVCQHLASLGFEMFSLSDMLRETATVQNIPHTRDELTQLGNTLKAKSGLACLAVKAVEKMNTRPNTSWAIDSIRNPEEAKVLKQAGVVLIAIDADITIRYKRITERKKETDQVDFETFKTQDDYERSGKSSGQFIDDTMKLCDITINNNGTEDELIEHVNKAITCHA